jgi:catechol 2,3-dioxygenase-like lactoylglutathione lyase family enzyme
MAGIIPEIAVADIERSLAFYTALGFEKDNTGVVDEQGSQWYSLALGAANLWLTRQDVVKGLWKDGPRGNGLNIYVTVDDVNAVYDHVRSGEYKANVVKEIETLYYGLRQFSISDPDGYLLTVNSPVMQQEEGAGAGAAS